VKHRDLRAALLMLIEEPPFALGGCELARELLPDVTDRLERGYLLKAVLTAAIRQLATMPGEWSYLICVWEYEEGRSRRENERRLAISRETYTRAKFCAMEHIDQLLPYLIDAARTIGA